MLILKDEIQAKTRTTVILTLDDLLTKNRK